MFFFFIIEMIRALKYEDAILFHWKGNLTADSITMKVFMR